jgi:hypothetical protein
MKDRDKLWFLINEYVKGKYDSKTFSNEFTRIYDLETDYDNIPENEKKWLYDLCEMTSRFSDDFDDLQIPNMYCSENEIKKYITLMLESIKY